MKNTSPILSQNEKQRYARHTVLSEIGLEGQIKLKQARVLCVGAGGLGSSALLYLASAGVGTIGIVEDDIVDLSNLQRQILYSDIQVGEKKVFAARDRLISINSNLDIIPIDQRLTEENAFDIIEPYDLVLDCTDSFSSRYLINDVCALLKKPYVFASIAQFEGQCTVFLPSNGPCYRCLYPEPPPSGLVLNCAEAGVVGVLPGILGCLQATEAIKWILKLGHSLQGRLLLVDTLTMQWREFSVPIGENCPICVGKHSFDMLKRPQDVCQSELSSHEISVYDLQHLIQQKAPFLLLDVRVAYEHAICNLGGYLIPLDQLADRLHEIDNKQHVIIYCKSGARSLVAASVLLNNGFLNVSILQGGIKNWIALIDTTMTSY